MLFSIILIIYQSAAKMIKHKFKLITLLSVGIPVIVILLAFLCVIMQLNSSGILYSVLNADDFDKWADTKEQITTELIACSADSNNYTKINIHRNYGIPRFGIVMNCAGQTLDTVWYIQNNINNFQNVFALDETDSSLTVWWDEKKSFNIVIMDALTGKVVIDSSFVGKGQPLSFLESIFKDEKPASAVFNYTVVPEGLHFAYVYDVNSKSIATVRTIRKGIEKIQFTENI